MSYRYRITPQMIGEERGMPPLFLPPPKLYPGYVLHRYAGMKDGFWPWSRKQEHWIYRGQFDTREAAERAAWSDASSLSDLPLLDVSYLTIP